MYRYLLKKFYNKNRLSIIFFVLVSLFMLPLESIGLSSNVEKIITIIQKNKNYKDIYKYILFIIIIYLVIRFMGCIQYYFEILIDNNLVEEIRDNMFYSLIEKYKKRYKEIEVGKLISYFTIVPNIYQDLIYRFLRYIVPYIGGILLLSLYYYYVHFKFGICISLYLLLVGAVLYFVGKECVKKCVKKFESYHNINENIQDKMTNILSILVNNQDKKEKQDNKHREMKHKSISLNTDLTILKLDIIINVITIMFFICMLYLFFKKMLIKVENLKLITPFLVFFYLVMYIDGVKWFIIDFFNLLGILKSFDKTFIIEEKKLKFGKKKDCINKGFIQMKNINISFNTKIIHNNLNIEFYPNKINTIIGKSGSGKSTILKMIIGLIPPNKGKILFDNTNITQIDLNYLRKNISVVSQDVKLFNSSVYSNISYGNNTNKEKINKLLNNFKIMNIYRNLPKDLDSNVGVNGSNLSNGQRQLILILRSYLQNKRIFILDEPTTSLDPKTKEIILNIIKNISKNKTTIIVTHDNSVKSISDNIINLKK